MFPTQRNSQGCFLFYRQWLFLFCWETLRHSRGNIQRCLSPAVSTKINAILTVVFLKHNLKHFRELRTLAESFFCFYPPLLTYFLRALLKSQTWLQLVSLFLLQVTTSCQTNTSYEPVSMTCACMCFSNLCVCQTRPLRKHLKLLLTSKILFINLMALPRIVSEPHTALWGRCWMSTIKASSHLINAVCTRQTNSNCVL